MNSKILNFKHFNSNSSLRGLGECLLWMSAKSREPKINIAFSPDNVTLHHQRHRNVTEGRCTGQQPLTCLSCCPPFVSG